MGNPVHFARVAVTAIVLSGCGSAPTGLESPKHPNDFRGYSGEDSTSKDMATKVTALDAAEKCCRAAPTVVCRNAVAGELKSYIDDYWRRFKSDFNGRVGVTNTIFDGTASTLTAAAAITTPDRAKNILAGLASSLLAIRTSAEKNLLGDQTAMALIGQMDSDRIVIGAKIDTGLDTKTLDEYSFTRAMSDVAEYGSSMSVISALVSLQRAGGANAQKVKDQQAETVVAAEKLKAANLGNQTATLEKSTAELKAAAAASAAKK